jgi:hypothetical protein
LLDSSHGRGIDPVLQENLGNNCEIDSVFKPNACLATVVEDLRKLSNICAVQDHTGIRKARKQPG